MSTIPTQGDAPLIRTDFSDDAAWRDLRAAAEAESPEGFRAYLAVLDDPGFRDLTPARLLAIAGAPGRPVIFIADAETFASPERPILCLEPSTGRSFRVVPAGLWAVENNLSVANMDFEEFLEEADADGVLRAT